MIKHYNDFWYKVYRSKTVKQLDRLIADSDKFIDNHPQFTFSWVNEYGQLLRAFRAEKVGK